MKNLTIRKMIEELQKYPNQDAEINFVFNDVNIDDDTFDEDIENISFFQQDVDDIDVVDIILYPQRAVDVDEDKRNESITELLKEHQRITIDLDMDSNIIITDKDNKPLRDIKVGGRHYPNENIAIMLKQLI